MRRNLTVAWETIGEYSTDLFTKEAVRLINEHEANEPMFLYLAHLAPHKGNQNQLLRAPDEEIAKFAYILDPERRIQAGNRCLFLNHRIENYLKTRSRVNSLKRCFVRNKKKKLTRLQLLSRNWTRASVK